MVWYARGKTHRIWGGLLTFVTSPKWRVSHLFRVSIANHIEDTLSLSGAKRRPAVCPVQQMRLSKFRAPPLQPLHGSCMPLCGPDGLFPRGSSGVDSANTTLKVPAALRVLKPFPSDVRSLSAGSRHEAGEASLVGCKLGKISDPSGA